MRNCTWSLNDKVRDNSQTSPAVLISSTRRILTQRFSEQDLAPFMIHELLLSPTETASGSHPCCVVSVTYHRPSYFHGGNTGSNPVGDAKSFKHLQNRLPRRYVLRYVETGFAAALRVLFAFPEPLPRRTRSSFSVTPNATVPAQPSDHCRSGATRSCSCADYS